MATAKKRRTRGGDDDGPGEGHNSERYDGEVLAGYLQTVFDAKAAMKARMSAASKKNEPDRKKIKAATKELVESGYASNVLAAVRRRAELEVEAASVASSLGDEEKEDFEAMTAALGPFADTELGKATLARARGEEE